MDLLGLGVVVLFALLIGGFTAREVRRPAGTARVLRRIDAFHSLPATLGQAVETGRRLHLSLGTGTIGEADTTTTLAGAAVVDQVSAAAAVSDRPPVVTTSDGTAMLLAQDILRGVYARQNALIRYDPESVQVPGLTPISFGAAQTTLQSDERVAGTVLIGPIGSEAVLLTEADRRLDITSVAGADNPATQALLFATADHPLIGEDTYAGGAYIGGAPAHLASLLAQDWARIAIAATIVIAVAVRTLLDLAQLVQGK